jgi:hypothetical protein
MKAWTRMLALTFVATAATLWLTGCGPSDKTQTPKTDKTAAGKSPQKTDADHKDHKDGDHKDGDHKDHKDGDHHDKKLTEKDVKLPASFKAGVTRLEELHTKIEHQIEHGELENVHGTAEEMSLVAGKMKELARKDVAEDQQTEAGRLCNEIIGYFHPIDDAADAGKKAETEAIHKKMAETIAKLKALAK